MVFRGFLFNDNATNALTATTDSRSEKYAELCLNDKFEAVFWFERLKKQFRLRGHARIIDNSHHPSLDLTKIQPQRLLADLLLLKQDVHDDIDEEGDDMVDSEFRLNQKPTDDDEQSRKEILPETNNRRNQSSNNALLSSHQHSNVPVSGDISRTLPDSGLDSVSNQKTSMSQSKNASQNSAPSTPHHRLFLQSKEVSEDEDDEDDDEGLEMCVSAHSDPDHKSEGPDDAQTVPLSSTLCSPSLFHKISQSSSDLSFTNLHDLSQFLYYPPTPEEWKAEITRQWTAMTKKMKKSFRKPPPSEPMTSKHCKTIDSIARGVDGKKDEAGLANFAVIALFVDYVDMVELDKDKRIIFRKDENHQWSESEVCP